jgi:16S rRNA (adenine1518-N6/adenine1519-N6)-dimethyltransferase
MAHQARKRFGQHFLVDGHIIQSIIALIRPDFEDQVIEIGPGLGAMTLPLLGELRQMDVVEIDRDLVKFWESKNFPNLKIHQADALSFNFQDWCSLAKNKLHDSSTGRVKIIGNLPYNISSPLLFHLMSAIEYVDEQVFMLQKEVVERIVAQPGDSEYSRLSVMLQTRYHVSLCFDVPPNSFSPLPRVDSAMVSMYPKEQLEISKKVWESLEKVVAQAFSQRRKVLANNLAPYRDILQLDAHVLRLRAQDIPIQDYLDWATRLANASAE